MDAIPGVDVFGDVESLVPFERELSLRLPDPLPQGAVDLNALISDLLEIFRVSQFNSLGIQERLALDPVVANADQLRLGARLGG